MQYTLQTHTPTQSTNQPQHIVPWVGVFTANDEEEATEDMTVCNHDGVSLDTATICPIFEPSKIVRQSTPHRINLENVRIFNRLVGWGIFTRESEERDGNRGTTISAPIQVDGHHFRAGI
jgi:hypothetical protein